MNRLLDPRRGMTLGALIGVLGCVLLILNVWLGNYLGAFSNLLLIISAYLLVRVWARTGMIEETIGWE